AVGGRTHDRLGGDIAAAPRPVLDDERLAEPLRQPLAYQACEDIESASCGGADNQTHGPRRIGLRPSEARHSRQRGRCQMQKISAGKFHFEPPSHHSITSSARTINVIGTWSPIALVALRLMISSNFVGCSTGRLEGLAREEFCRRR